MQLWFDEYGEFLKESITESSDIWAPPPELQAGFIVFLRMWIFMSVCGPLHCLISVFQTEYYFINIYRLSLL